MAPSLICNQELTMSKRARIGQTFIFDIVRYNGAYLRVSCEKELEEVGLDPKNRLQARRFEVELDGFYGDSRFAIQNVLPPSPPYFGDMNLYAKVLAFYRKEYPRKPENFTENWYFDGLKRLVEHNNRRGRGFIDVVTDYRNCLTKDKQSVFDSIIESQETNTENNFSSEIRDKHMFD